VKAKLFENRRDFDVKCPTQRQNVAIIRLIRRVPRMAAHLEFSGLALDWFAGDRSCSVEGAYLERQPRRSVRSNPARGDQRFIEINEMYIDQSSTWINEHPIEIVVHAISAKACRFHRCRTGGAVYGRDRYVEIFMLARLMAQERINPPTAIQPDSDAVVFEAVE
jgi:hypothetical protein